VVLVAELTLYGQFTEIPERLFYRRIHDEAFSSLPSTTRQRAYVDPRLSSRINFYFWRHSGEYLRAVLRAPLSRREKAQLLYGLVKRSVASRATLAHELSAGVFPRRRDKT